MLKIRIALIVVCVALLVIVAVQNSGVVALRFLSWHTSISLVTLVFLTAGAGLVIGFTLGKVGGKVPKVTGK